MRPTTEVQQELDRLRWAAEQKAERKRKREAFNSNEMWPALDAAAERAV